MSPRVSISAVSIMGDPPNRFRWADEEEMASIEGAETLHLVQGELGAPGGIDRLILNSHVGPDRVSHGGLTHGLSMTLGDHLGDIPATLKPHLRVREMLLGPPETCSLLGGAGEGGLDLGVGLEILATNP